MSSCVKRLAHLYLGSERSHHQSAMGRLSTSVFPARLWMSTYKKEFMEAGKERLTRDTVRDATRQEIEHLKRENNDLKQLVADLSLEVHRFKKTAIPALDGNAGA